MYKSDGENGHHGLRRRVRSPLHLLCSLCVQFSRNARPTSSLVSSSTTDLAASHGDLSLGKRRHCHHVILCPLFSLIRCATLPVASIRHEVLARTHRSRCPLRSRSTSRRMERTRRMGRDTEEEYLIPSDQAPEGFQVINGDGQPCACPTSNERSN